MNFILFFLIFLLNIINSNSFDMGTATLDGNVIISQGHSSRKPKINDLSPVINFAEKQKELSIIHDLIIDVGALFYIEQSRDLTFFMPTDNAFKNSNLNLSKMSWAEKWQMLKSHIIPQQLLMLNLMESGEYTYNTWEGHDISIKLEKDCVEKCFRIENIYIDENPLGIETYNGIVYIINDVLIKATNDTNLEYIEDLRSIGVKHKERNDSILQGKGNNEENEENSKIEENYEKMKKSNLSANEELDIYGRPFYSGHESSNKKMKITSETPSFIRNINASHNEWNTSVEHKRSKDFGTFMNIRLQGKHQDPGVDNNVDLNKNDENYQNNEKSNQQSNLIIPLDNFPNTEESIYDDLSNQEKIVAETSTNNNTRKSNTIPMSFIDTQKRNIENIQNLRNKKNTKKKKTHNIKANNYMNNSPKTIYKQVEESEIIDNYNYVPINDYIVNEPKRNEYTPVDEPQIPENKGNLAGNKIIKNIENNLYETNNKYIHAKSSENDKLWTSSYIPIDQEYKRIPRKDQINESILGSENHPLSYDNVEPAHEYSDKNTHYSDRGIQRGGSINMYKVREIPEYDVHTHIENELHTQDPDITYTNRDIPSIDKKKIYKNKKLLKNNNNFINNFEKDNIDFIDNIDLFNQPILDGAFRNERGIFENNNMYTKNNKTLIKNRQIESPHEIIEIYEDPFYRSTPSYRKLVINTEKYHKNYLENNEKIHENHEKIDENDENGETERKLNFENLKTHHVPIIEGYKYSNQIPNNDVKNIDNKNIINNDIIEIGEDTIIDNNPKYYKAVPIQNIPVKDANSDQPITTPIETPIYGKKIYNQEIIDNPIVTTTTPNAINVYSTSIPLEGMGLGSLISQRAFSNPSIPNAPNLDLLKNSDLMNNNMINNGELLRTVDLIPNMDKINNSEMMKNIDIMNNNIIRNNETINNAGEKLLKNDLLQQLKNNDIINNENKLNNIELLPNVLQNNNIYSDIYTTPKANIEIPNFTNTNLGNIPNFNMENLQSLPNFNLDNFNKDTIDADMRYFLKNPQEENKPMRISTPEARVEESSDTDEETAAHRDIQSQIEKHREEQMAKENKEKIENSEIYTEKEKNSKIGYTVTEEYKEDDIVSLLNKLEELSELRKLMSMERLSIGSSKLLARVQMTLFAPVNDTLTRKDATSGVSLKDMFSDINREIDLSKISQEMLNNHISLGRKIDPDSIQKDTPFEVPAKGGNTSISITKHKNGDLYVNQTAKVLRVIHGSNGLLYEIDRVLTPRYGEGPILTELIENEPSLNTLKSFIGKNMLIKEYGGIGPITVLLVSDENIRTSDGNIVPRCVVDALQRPENDKFTKKLLLHMTLSGITKIQDMAEDEPLTPLYGPDIHVTQSKFWQLNSDTTYLDTFLDGKRIIKANIPIYNGIAHLIEGLLEIPAIDIPSLSYWSCLDSHLRENPLQVKTVLEKVDAGKSLPILGTPPGERPDWVADGLPRYYPYSQQPITPFVDLIFKT